MIPSARPAKGVPVALEPETREELSARLLDAVHESIALLQPVRDDRGVLVDHVVDWANESWRSRHCPDGQDPHGRRASELVADLGCYLPLHDAVLTTGRAQRADRPLPDGRWLSIEFTRFGDRMLAVGRDITAQRAADLAFKESQAELAEAQRLAHVGSWTWEPRTDRVGWSEEMFRIFGMKLAAQGPPWAEQQLVLTPETREPLLQRAARASRTGEAFEVPVDLVRPDGSLRHVIARGEGVPGPDGSILRVRGTLIDVTELREAQARTQEAQRAQLIGRVAGGVAHEFNNLLMAILGNAELLAESLPPDDPRHQELGVIREAGTRGVSLTRQLLASGRRQMLHPEVLDLEAVLGELTPTLRTMVGDQVVLVVRALGPASPVRADRAFLEQAITHLALNARDAMPEGGHLFVELDSVTVTGEDPELPPLARPGDYTRLSVRDSGVGIEPEALPHIFEPFFTTKTVGRGVGLGLPSVEGMAAQSGGFVTVDSTPGRGSTFRLHLPPAKPEPPRVRPRRSFPTRAPRRATVLVVDDDPRVRSLTARMVRGLGYAVVEVGEPEQVLALARGGDPGFDVLVTDLVMPGISGRYLARQLQELKPGLPILFLSGFSRETIREDDLLEDGSSVLTKPFSRDELATWLQGVLGGPGAEEDDLELPG